jgi:hypothetical protein
VQLGTVISDRYGHLSASSVRKSLDNPPTRPRLIDRQHCG